MSRTSIVSSLGLALVCLLLAFPVFATTFSVDVVTLGTASGPIPQALLDGAFAGSLGTTGVASASSERGILRAKSFIQNPISCNCSPQTDHLVGGTATVLVDDAMIIGPPEVTQITTTLHLVLDGTLAITGAFPWGTRLEATILCGTGGGQGFIVLRGDGLLSGGIFAGQSSPIVSRAIDIATTVPVNTPFSMSFSMSALVGGTAGSTVVNTATINFFDAGGLHFPASGPFSMAGGGNLGGNAAPVFTLPDGYTAQIPSLNVVDNVWTTGNPLPVENSTWGHVKSLYR
jgi:hypothetical protein